MFFNWQRKVEKAAPYSQLAHIYDFLMQHVDYKRWANFITQNFARYHPQVRTVVDIACGSGTLIFYLYEKGYIVAGQDRSLDMIRKARQKACQKAWKIPLWQGDMRSFSLRQPADAIICLYDSINYLMSLAECRLTFLATHGSLKKDGIFIFDICTERNSKKNFNNYYEENEGENFRYSRKSYYLKKEKIHVNEFKIRFNDSDIEYREYHQQRIYTINEMEHSVSESGFRVLDILEDFSMKRADESSNRAHFVLQKV